MTVMIIQRSQKRRRKGKPDLEPDPGAVTVRHLDTAVLNQRSPARSTSALLEVLVDHLTEEGVQRVDLGGRGREALIDIPRAEGGHGQGQLTIAIAGGQEVGQGV